MFPDEMVEDTYGILTDSDDFIHIDTAVAMTLDTFGYDSEDAVTYNTYMTYYLITSDQMFGHTGSKD